MGHVIGSFGVQGCIKVSPYTEHIDGLLEYSTWWLGRGDGQWREMEATNGHVNGNTLTVKLSKCNDRTEALQFKGMQIAIPRSHLPDLSENGDDGYYWSDLIGTTVINLQDEELGKVTGLLETGANDVLQVQNPSEKEILIPFIDHVIMRVDLKSLKIIVDWSADY